MIEDFFFEIKQKTGGVIRYEMLDAFFCSATGKNYILYTNNILDENNKIKVYASTYDPNEYQIKLSPIETDEEWKYIENYLNNEVSEE